MQSNIGVSFRRGRILNAFTTVRHPFAGILVVLALFISAAPSWGQKPASPFPVIGRAAPDFTLKDQQGRMIRLADLRGRLILLNFIYTNCRDVCPITTATLTRVQRGLISRGWWTRDVVFLTVTTDPARDTVAVLAAYANRYKADPHGWHFLTGDEVTLRKIYRVYGVTVTPIGVAQEHDLPTFVIDRRGMVLGAYRLGFESEDVLRDLEHLR